MSKMIFGLLFLISTTASAQTLSVVSSGYVTGAKAVTEYYVNGDLVADDEQRTYQPAMIEHPDLGFLGSSGFSNGDTAVAVSADPNNSSQVAYASANINASWTSLLASNKTNPFIKIDSEMVCLGIATIANRRAESDALVSGHIFRLFTREDDSGPVHAIITITGTAPTENKSNFRAFLHGIWGESKVTATWDDDNNYWIFQKSILNENAVRVNTTEYITKKTFTRNVDCYTMFGDGGYVVSHAIIDSTTDPRYPEWAISEHHLSTTALSSGSGAIQQINAEAKGSVKVTPTATVLQE